MTGAKKVCLQRASEIPMEVPIWLWKGWLCKGKLHILAGAPGTGKTAIALDFAATISKGGRWPDGNHGSPGDVVMWSGEDAPSDTLIPRLVAADAQLDRVQFISSVAVDGKTRDFDPAIDLPDLRRELLSRKTNIDLLIIDPVVSAVKGDSHRNAEVRRALQPLVDLAQRAGCAILGISHFSKGSAGRDPTERVTGSVAYGALPRVVMATAKVPAQDGRGDNRVFLRTKCNIGPDDGGYFYEMVLDALPTGLEVPRIEWGQPIVGSAKAFLNAAEAVSIDTERRPISEAEDFIRSVLGSGPVAVSEIKREAKCAGIAERTLERAKAKLGFRSYKAPDGKWYWPPFEARPPRAPLQNGGVLGGVDELDDEALAVQALLPRLPVAHQTQFESVYENTVKRGGSQSVATKEAFKKLVKWEGRSTSEAKCRD